MRKIITHLKENWIRHGFESFVVVVGILGAFALNNWNESLKNSRTEEKLLIRLHTEVLANKSQLEEIVARHQAGVDNMHNLITLYQNDPISKHFELQDSVYRNAFRGLNWTFNPSMGQLKSIISSGQIKYISNNEFVGHLSDFENQYNDANEGIIRTIEIWDNTLAPLIFKYTEWWRSDNLFGKSAFSPDYDGLFRSREIEAWIRFFQQRYMNGLEEEKKLLDKLKLMTSMIETELRD